MQTVENAHPPGTERLLSNVGHWVEGSILTGAGALLLVDGEENQRRAARLLMAAGSLLGLALVGGSFHHGGPRAFFRADPQQRQHLKMAAIIGGAGALRGRGRLGRTVADGGVAEIGRMFLTHEQHGTDDAAALAMRRHRLLGATAVGSGLALAAGDTVGSRGFRRLGGALAVAAGLQLLAYREPPGAYEPTQH